MSAELHLLAEFAALRYLALDGTEHRGRGERNAAIEGRHPLVVSGDR